MAKKRGRIVMFTLRCDGCGPFSEEFNAQPFPMIVCAGCGIERGDLYANATLTEDAATGREVRNGESWEYELPFTHSDPPPFDP